MNLQIFKHKLFVNFFYQNNGAFFVHKQITAYFDICIYRVSIFLLFSFQKHSVMLNLYSKYFIIRHTRI